MASNLPGSLEIVFVASPRQNAFFFELIDLFRYELTRLGVRTRTSTRGFPAAHWGQVFILVAPHEYVALEAFKGDAHANLLARTIFVCTEQPGTQWFETSAQYAPLAGAVFDINRRAVDELSRRAIACRHFQLGYSEAWDRLGDAAAVEATRPIDVLFLGGWSLRRGRRLAECGRVLSQRRARLIICDNSRPNTGAAPNFFVGDAKRRLLGESRVLLNIHRDEEPYFEWVRAIEAIHCGSVLVTEPATDYQPLVPGYHFLGARPEALPDVLEAALDDDTLLVRIRRAALDLLRETPVSRGVMELAAVASELTSKPVSAPVVSVGQPETGPSHSRFEPGSWSESRDGSVLRQVAKELRLDLIEVRRALRRNQLGGDERQTRIVDSTPGYRAARGPRVSVLMALHSHAQYVEEAISSVRRSTFGDSETIVVDDGSTDDSCERVLELMRATPRYPILLLQHPVNRGVGPARNSALAFARGEFAFILDADNALYPAGLGELVAALDADRSAAMAYGLLEAFGPQGSTDLVSYWPWEPERFRANNFIDAMALVRTSAIRELGGYTADRRLYGWEDYDLWCGFAERGFRGVLVPNIVGRYRTSPTSMLAVTNVAPFAAFAALVERHPALMAGVTLPE